MTRQIAAMLHGQALEGAVWTTLDTQGAAGISDARSRAPMRPDHRMQVGSIAKTLLAAGILRLASEGRLGLDMPVAALLPAMAFDNPWHASDPVRIRHLLDHTSGLDDVHFWQVFTMKARADAPLAATFPAGSGLLRVRHRPGTRHSYSNMGYTLLGMVIEAVARQRYERYLDAALLAPLGMHDSTFAFVEQASDPRLAMGHFEDGAVHPAVPSFVRPAGQFTTTAADMARFARFLMSDGSAGGRPFIDPALLRRMGEPTGTEAARAGLQVGYGLGLRKFDRHGVVAKCHGGSTIGFKAMLCLFPEAHKAFFIAFNTDNETADYQRFDALLAGVLMPAMPAAAAGEAPAFDPQPWEGVYVPAPNRFDTVRFIDTVFGFMRLRGDGSALSLHPFQGPAVTLQHAGNALFRAPGKVLPSHALLVSADGKRIVTNGTQSHEQVSMLYLSSLWLSVGAGLLGLAWIVLKGMARLAARRMSPSDPLAAPLAGALALLVPLPLFYRQSFLQLGDLTAASGLLAIVTAALPVTMLAGLAMALRSTGSRTGNRIDALAMAAVLQLAIGLAAWELLPLRLWD
ncbi:serine hydrolase domain-containing protein [Pseudoduganella umbonata]|uniref:CubicO group peptidase (Beta-lactamase class C family) n=1 Tax=Pseudoduganella umbonata TaxID=864828 RepID=A0A7W5HD79_9BURK|nr:serine hydrolase domain-containing protein [Pseudoduganella umbonata]MBB3222388.1 CubicO group peptidase (beta-lactamase class C family) [Pseudoduganella umbonata]